MSVDKHSTEAKALAQKVAESMFAVDIATKDTMGMTILACEPGRAVLRMVAQKVSGVHGRLGSRNGRKMCVP